MFSPWSRSPIWGTCRNEDSWGVAGDHLLSHQQDPQGYLPQMDIVRLCSASNTTALAPAAVPSPLKQRWVLSP